MVFANSGTKNNNYCEELYSTISSKKKGGFKHERVPLRLPINQSHLETNTTRVIFFIYLFPFFTGFHNEELDLLSKWNK